MVRSAADVNIGNPLWQGAQGSCSVNIYPQHPCFHLGLTGLPEHSAVPVVVLVGRSGPVAGASAKLAREQRFYCMFGIPEASTI